MCTHSQKKKHVELSQAGDDVGAEVGMRCGSSLDVTGVLAKNENCRRGARVVGLPRSRGILRLFLLKFKAEVEATNRKRSAVL